MRHELRIGVHAEDNGSEGWIRILQQEMLPWDSIDGPERRIILFSGNLPSWSAEFVSSGGIAVISGAPRADDLLGTSIAATIHRFRPPGGDRECVMPCLARLFRGREGQGECRLHENRKARAEHLADIYPAVLSRSHGQGAFIFTGLPLAAHLSAAGDCLRNFTDVSSVSERVASVDKADIADTLTWMLQEAIRRLGLPYVRPARYPNAAASVFLFRVDVDGLFGTGCRDLALVAARHGIAGSFYFSAALCRAHPGELSSDWLATHEIGHHADRHDLFDTVEENRENLVKGMAWVKETLGVSTTGYVAPRGLWNEALDIAMAGLGHVYSSDFALDFDSLPFLTPAGVLQIPVHPFSAERYTIHEEDAGHGPPSTQAVVAHYVAGMKRQYALRRPVHLYGHPEVLGRMAGEVLPEIFAEVARLELPSMTLAAFADWWLQRGKIEMALSVDEATGRLHVETSSASHPIEAHAWTDTTVTIGEGGRHELEAGCWSVLQSGKA
jgi:hypothetical protein